MRLIDADALIDFIDPEHLRHPDELSFSEVDVVNILNHAPTAYDVEKVIERLEAIKENGACDGENCGHCKYFKTCWEGEMSDRLALDKAIKIVKGGGIDG